MIPRNGMMPTHAQTRDATANGLVWPASGPSAPSDRACDRRGSSRWVHRDSMEVAVGAGTRRREAGQLQVGLGSRACRTGRMRRRSTEDRIREAPPSPCSWGREVRRRRPRYRAWRRGIRPGARSREPARVGTTSRPRPATSPDPATLRSPPVPADHQANDATRRPPGSGGFRVRTQQRCQGTKVATPMGDLVFFRRTHLGERAAPAAVRDEHRVVSEAGVAGWRFRER